jgi:lipopolysaccharide export LptBFGC system permease protein LptF
MKDLTYKQLKLKLSELITENEALHDKIKRLKYKYNLLRKEKQVLVENTVPDGISTDSELEFKEEIVLPMSVGVLTLISLGRVCLKPNYHTDRYIYPIGFSSSRYF